MNQIKIKVCGMRDPGNIGQVCAAGPDYLGFIFHPGSARYIGENPDPSSFERVPASIKKAGVFVNEEMGTLIRLCTKYGFFAAQLHGNEPPGYCQAVKESGLTVIKAFPLHDTFDFSVQEAYTGVVDYFLFDTKGRLPGGTGKKFNWQILDRYGLRVPFFLSGGIGPADAGELKKLRYPQLFALDINSGFETAPALKDARKVKEFIKEMRNGS